MRLRRFGRLNWQVSEIGYGMWGLGGGLHGWTGGDDDTSWSALQEAVRLGCNFFDTAWVYGRGHSERTLGRFVKANRDRRLYLATKVPPKDMQWPSTRDSRLEDIFPADHIREYVELSLGNLGLDRVDLLQFHVWEDSWATDTRWQRTIAQLLDERLIGSVGVSVNRWEPTNVLATLDTGLIDAVQVIYNIFDQAPEDELFDACRDKDVAVIARVPFDEGTLTGTLTADTTWPPGDWRESYFVPENLTESVERAERLREDLPDGMTMPELALRFILHHPAVSTVIPGMRRIPHVRSNMAVSDGVALPPQLLTTLRQHRWDRKPTWWSQ
jgi:aryl-alcohol dehydrogenase-like predicted oxidoreductase